MHGRTRPAHGRARELRAWRNRFGAGRVTLWLRTVRHVDHRDRVYLTIEWDVCAPANVPHNVVRSNRTVELPALGTGRVRNEVTMALARELIEALP